MTNFEGTQMTNAGVNLVGKSGMSVTFTKVQMGSGTYTADEDISNQTALKEVRQETRILDISRLSDSTIQIKFLLSNKEVTEAYLFTEIGIFARDPDDGEVLYGVAYATPEDADRVRAYNGIFEWRVNIAIAIGLNNGKSAGYDAKGLYALKEDLLKHEEDTGNPHTVVKKQVGLGNADDTADVDKPVSTKQQAAIDAAREALQTQITTNKSNLDNLTTEVNSYGFTVADGKLCLIYNK